LNTMFDIGLSSGGERRPPDMPLYTLRNLVTGEIVKTTDPGQGLITGKWADVNKFKTPTLRALAARPPYFHNGVIPDLKGVVEFYDGRFQIGLTENEKTDLEAFLGSL